MSDLEADSGQRYRCLVDDLLAQLAALQFENAALREAQKPNDEVVAAAEHMFNTLCITPPYVRELYDAVSDFWRAWIEWINPTAPQEGK